VAYLHACSSRFWHSCQAALSSLSLKCCLSSSSGISSSLGVWAFQELKMPSPWLTLKKASLQLRFGQLEDGLSRIIPEEVSYLIIEIDCFPESILIDFEMLILNHQALGSHESEVAFACIGSKIQLDPLMQTLLEVNQHGLIGRNVNHLMDN